MFDLRGFNLRVFEEGNRGVKRDKSVIFWTFMSFINISLVKGILRIGT